MAPLGHRLALSSIERQEFLDVCSGNKRFIASAGQNNALQAGAPGSVFSEELLQLQHGLAVQCIKGLLPVDRNRYNAVIILNEQVFVIHIFVFFS